MYINCKLALSLILFFVRGGGFFCPHVFLYKIMFDKKNIIKAFSSKDAKILCTGTDTFYFLSNYGDFSFSALLKTYNSSYVYVEKVNLRNFKEERFVNMLFFNEEEIDLMHECLNESYDWDKEASIQPLDWRNTASEMGEDFMSCEIFEEEFKYVRP